MSTVQDQDDVPALIKSLKHSKTDIRRAALRALARLGPAAAAAIPRLSACLRDEDAALRDEAARALVQIGPAAVPALMEALANPDREVRRQAAWAMKRLGATSPIAVPTLTRALKDPDPRVRKGAALALGALDAAAEEAIPALMEALKDNHLVFCRLVASALAEIGPAAVPSLAAALADPDKYIRREAAWALGQIGPAARMAVPALLKALHELQEEAQVHAPEAPPEVDRSCVTDVVFIAPLKDADVLAGRSRKGPDKALKVHVIQALGAIGPDAGAAGAALLEALSDTDARVCRAAAQALARLQGRPSGMAAEGRLSGTEATPTYGLAHADHGRDHPAGPRLLRRLPTPARRGMRTLSEPEAASG
jgi:HEAT repeat protein